VSIDWVCISLKELAALVSDTLREGGVDAILVGGACVSLYTNNKYQSYDLDFVTHSPLKDITPLLKKIGFLRESTRHFTRKGCPFFVEFVAPPAAIGDEPVTDKRVMRTKYGKIVMLTVSDSVKDRLAAYFHWQDPQSLEQAVLVARSRKVDLKEIRRWSRLEGFEEKFRDFEKRLKS
jgi:hypothetical protein